MGVRKFGNENAILGSEKKDACLFHVEKTVRPGKLDLLMLSYTHDRKKPVETTMYLARNKGKKLQMGVGERIRFILEHQSRPTSDLSIWKNESCVIKILSRSSIDPNRESRGYMGYNEKRNCIELVHDSSEKEGVMWLQCKLEGLPPPCSGFRAPEDPKVSHQVLVRPNEEPPPVVQDSNDDWDW